ncbi:hypothetical protein [Halalkalibacter akibai]|uniref:Uncharacterized protein n=1 Tax=Halalkalibacter akibai (strain ATCC 43226 / DSM 21942 / CIP 109018 / JCM 9157 / 1139) TaxID=1236973 RepID=W4QPS0_HALA3|nr:hypothetical protein [Halalkalibacter akibai]GAE34066.1 hypothetical protein JCM9157_1099 [Halalkalibacter akibai JCM 9157]
MLNSKLKKNSLETLKKLNNQYSELGEIVQTNSIELLDIRNDSSNSIKEIENYVNTLANKPKEFDITFAEVKIYMEKFQAILDIEYDEKKANQISGGIAGAGVAMGAGVAAFGPTAALAVATTFGTASTGTAISALSGAAATKAALAWLGGGALAAGGGGMVAGKALLALAGPVGWAIGGSALVGGALFANKKNKDLAVQAQNESIEVQKQIAILDAANIEIHELIELNTLHLANIEQQLALLTETGPSDYGDFTVEQKQEIGSLVNNTLSLSKLINKKVGK